VKVVLFCGGLGLRMGSESSRVPKPMIPVGDRPILWHIMKYYASFGVREFILCLGYRGEAVKEYFLRYEALASDFVLLDGGGRMELEKSDIHDWSISFVNTGLNSMIGERLRLVERHLGDDEIFLANYGDTLTDAPLPEMVSLLRDSGKTALFLCTRPTHNVHVVELGEGNSVADIRDITKTDMRINGGYFVFRREIFDYIREGEDLVEEPFQRLIAEKKLMAYPYEGFWAAMDTLKEKQHLEGLLESGQAPWARWERNGARGGADPARISS
jgi:glucose-1-phosphate cytidylyltransferase